MKRAQSKRLPGLIALLVAGVGASTVAVSMQKGFDLSERVLYPGDVLTGPPAATLAGFAPALCAGNMPPAELLALADWPLDPIGETCLPHRIARDHEAVEVIERSWSDAAQPAYGRDIELVSGHKKVVPLAEVVERIWVSAQAVAARFAVADSNETDAMAASGKGVLSAPEAGAVAGVSRTGDVAELVVLAERIRLGAESLMASERSVEPAGAGQVAAGKDNKLGAADPFAAISQKGDELVLFAGAKVVADEVMDTVRGGFETANGLRMSFGIERLVYINGELSSTTRLNVSDLGALTGGAINAASLPAIGSTVAVIQNGPNNTFVADALSSGAIATVIQNSLDNQHINAVTTVNASVNSLQMMHANRLGETLRGAASGALLR